MNWFKEDEIVKENEGAAETMGEAGNHRSSDGIDRRNFLGCMAWAGTGLLWSMVGGVPTSRLLAQTMKAGGGAGTGKVEDFSFVQISDCHIGFNKGANPDVTGTLKKAIDRANTAPAGMKAPDFMLHTGDITQNSKAAEFDTASEVIKGFKGEVFYVPGEHDFIDDGVRYKQRFGKGAMGNGWYSYNHKGVHFVGLNNCVQVDAMGNLGADQLLAATSARRSVEEVREPLMASVRRHFRPEFLNRIDDIVIFHRLSRDQITQIVDVQLERLRQMLHERNVSIVLDNSAKELLAREGYDPSFGARPLKRAIQTLIQNPLAMKLLEGDIKPGDTVHVSARNGEMVFERNKVAAAA